MPCRLVIYQLIFGDFLQPEGICHLFDNSGNSGVGFQRMLLLWGIARHTSGLLAFKLPGFGFSCYEIGSGTFKTRYSPRLPTHLSASRQCACGSGVTSETCGVRRTWRLRYFFDREGYPAGGNVGPLVADRRDCAPGSGWENQRQLQVGLRAVIRDDSLFCKAASASGSDVTFYLRVIGFGHFYVQGGCSCSF